MNLDLLIPFGILISLVVYLIYTRTKFEKEMLSLYEGKFNEWKKHYSKEEKPAYKELVGLIFEENGKISVELHKVDSKQKILQGKFEIKE